MIRRIALGLGYVDRFTVFEFKRWMSLYFHRWNTIEQDRWHTHAFGALVLVLRGGYWESVIERWSYGTVIRYRWVGPGIRWIPRHYNHRILRSVPNSISVAIAGPWAETWTETFPGGKVVRYAWGRRRV